MSVYQDLLVKLKWTISSFGLAYVFGRYYSFYRATVIENVDPEKRGRIRVTCPAVSQKGVLDWALPVALHASPQKGHYFPPEIDDVVLVGFEEGDARFPFYIGGYWAKDALPTVFSDAEKPTVRGIVTPSGHQLVFEDTEDKERVVILTAKKQTLAIIDEKDKQEIKLEWVRDGDKASLTFLTNGNIELVNREQAKLTMDADAKSITLVDPNKTTLFMDEKGWVVKDKDGNKVEIQNAGMVLSTSKTIHVKGSDIIFNNGTAKVARVGDATVPHTHTLIAGQAGPYPVASLTISTESPKIKEGAEKVKA